MKSIKLYFLGLLLFATVLVWYVVFVETRDGLTIAFLDVGQGDAIFIEAPNGNQILLDAGPNGEVTRELGTVMPFYDRSIDMIIASHPDSDHIGGFPDVIKNYNIGLAMEPGVGSETAIYREFEKLLDKKDIQKVLARRNMRVNMGDGAYLDILFPDRDPSGLDTNDASIVAKLIYGDTSFLLTGDSPQKIEKYLSEIYGDGLKVDVLKAGHHGSKTSSSEVFLGFTNPDYAIISAGFDNRYGHPHQEVLDRLAQFEIPILSTAELGTIIFKTDGGEIKFAN